MKLDAFADKTVETTEEYESQEFAIDSESLGVLFKGFSDSLYSNKIGSIVREITSNCFDSHVEAGVTRDVEIELLNEGLDGRQATIIFRDFGVGLSPERISNVYRKYFASTKRDNNSAIGGFGIGAKTPLSYTDIFTVQTSYNGTEYTYVVHRGLTVPELKLIEKKPTDKHNGTEIIITIKNYSDKVKFRDELRRQLMYFDGITFINTELKNDYSIYQGKHFLFRPDQNTYSETHAVIGKVAYPIDFNQLGLYRYEHDCPIAVRFDIGEIAVTMTRESIEYTEKTIEVMTNRINEAFEELQGIYDRQVEDTDDLLYALRNSKANDQVRLADEVMVKGGKKLKVKGCVYKPFDRFKSNTLYYHDFIGRFVEVRCYIDKDGNKNESKEVKARDVTKLFLSGARIYRTKDKVTKRKSLFLAEQVGDFYVISLCGGWEERVQDLSQTIGSEDLTFIRKEALKVVLANSSSYDSVEVTKEWLDNYLEGIKSDNQLYKDPTEMSVKTLFFDLSALRSGIPFGAKFTMDTFKVSEVANFCRKGGMVVYSSYDEDEVNDLIRAGAVLACIPYFGNESYYGEKLSLESKRVRVIKVSMDSAKKLEKMPNTVNASEFLKKYRKIVIRTLCARKISTQEKVFKHYASIHVTSLIPGAEEMYTHLYDFHNKYYRSTNNSSIDKYIQELSDTFEQDLDYRYFAKGEPQGIDIYALSQKMINTLKPISFLANLTVNTQVGYLFNNVSYREQLREYLIFKGLIVKTI